MLRGRAAECERLDQLLAQVREGRSGVLVLRGEPGVGKTALLGYAAERASGFRVASIAGVESELEFAYAGLHLLCAPLLSRLPILPQPQRLALEVALGLAAGERPDRLLVGLATLGLLTADAQPFLCVIDDFQWLDDASARVLEFVAGRALAEPLGLVFAVRQEQLLGGLPELAVSGLAEADARALLETVVPGPIDEGVRERIVAEAQGNPLALLELPRWMTADGGFARPAPLDIEDGYRRRIEALSAESRTLLQLAAADPEADVSLVRRAADRLGITADFDPDLVEVGAQIRFRHPLLHSAAYRSASADERCALHAALAEVTEAPDRRAWHHAQASSGPDEAVAAELEHAAADAQARGGVAAAAGFLARAAELTPDPVERTRRLLAAAHAKRDAGALDEAEQLLSAAGPLSALQAAEAEHLRGRIAFDDRRAGDAARLLGDAARRLEPLDPQLARMTQLEALGAAIWSADDGTILEAARAAPPAPAAPTAVDVVLDALATRLREGTAPEMRPALETVLALPTPDRELGHWLWLTGFRAAGLIALDLWDIDAWHELASRQVRVARDAGALVQLQFALNFLARCTLARGELAEAEVLISEERALAVATDSTAVGYNELLLAAWRGYEARAGELIERMVAGASARGLGRMVDVATYAKAVLYNGIGRYDAAREAARQAFEHRDHVALGMFVVGELAEAASRTGDQPVLEAALDWVSTRDVDSDWQRGIAARVRALLTDDEADYRASVEHLERTPLRTELARSHLLHGEWLRRSRRRSDAREPLRTAHDLFAAVGADGFAERAHHELVATGETARKRRDDTRGDLTAHEEHIARLALAGHTNPEIGAELFISSRTVEWHLKNVFTKLEIASRKELRRALG
ncbi:AAA family ATPase [Solirubrobacter ginsenosidimutans]|uniref:AAA family ATPase n=1 Tax=Solirubrobacter ginsenosidimutans TaxID=490573 RepID=A0A9X3N070_9ACTN|nr:helix-turn-helix transcriptional regulator [Solirubrobacter ginsenosidimutans]MDA0166039.1 AAA family ATPase [Solirubrobacter ginsenosidimutans]